MKKGFWLFIILFLGSWTLSSCQSCSQKLEDATRTFYQGQLRKVEPHLSSCLSKGFTREEKIAAMKLLVNTELLLHNRSSAIDYIRQLLILDPGYPVKESDLQEFQTLMKEFERSPTYSIGMIAGWNYSQPKIDQSFNVDGSLTPSTINGKMGLHMGLSGMYFVTDHLMIKANTEFYFQQWTIEKRVLEIHDIQLEEKQHLISFPIVGKYIFHLPGFSPFLEMGYRFHYLLSSTGQIFRSNTTTNLTVIDFDYNLSPFRHKSQNHLILGAGILKDAGRNYLLLNIDYQIGLSNITKGSNRYGNQDLVFVYGYVDDDFVTNSLSLTLSYLFNHYQPKLKTR